MPCHILKVYSLSYPKGFFQLSYPQGFFLVISSRFFPCHILKAYSQLSYPTPRNALFVGWSVRPIFKIVGHTAWALEGCEGAGGSQGGSKGFQLEVGAQKAPRLLNHLILHQAASLPNFPVSSRSFLLILVFFFFLQSLKEEHPYNSIIEEEVSEKLKSIYRDTRKVFIGIRKKYL